MKFKDFAYRPVDINRLKIEYNGLINLFISSKSVNAQIKIFEKYQKFNAKVLSYINLANIRFTINTYDDYYAYEVERINEILPVINSLNNRFYKVILSSPYRKGLERKFGTFYFQKIEQKIKVFDYCIYEDLLKEKKLENEYTKLLTSAKLRFRGRMYTLSQIAKIMDNQNRITRSAASKAYYSWFESHEEIIDDIFDQLIHVRDKMAKKLGYSNYVEMGYDRLGRIDYTPEDIKNYRNEIYRYVVPLSKQLFKRQARRINVRNIKYFDYNIFFSTGNPTPLGNINGIVNRAKEVYGQLSNETKSLIEYMIDNELMDLPTRDGKAIGGYYEYLSYFNSPFIFSNFNGTYTDVTVLNHEIGHALMAYCCKDFIIIDNIWPSFEACEIPSMAMEFFVYPWLEDFFGNQTEKYKFLHLSKAITFLPYGVAIDEFQEYMYQNVDITPADRKAKWREIEKKYLPHLKYGNNNFLESGGRFMRQSQIFTNPFYYIDYTLAQICAFQFFNEINDNYQNAWDRYLNLCKLGGSKSFLSLLKSVKLNNPLAKGVIKKTIKPIKEYLLNKDDFNM